MESDPHRLGSVPAPPGWLSVLVVAGTVAAFGAVYPFEPGMAQDTVAEAIYLGLAVLVLYPIHRLDVGLLEIGAQLLVLSRLVEFLDELYVGAKPFVEPFLSGLLLLMSIVVLSGGVYTIVNQREAQLDVLETRAAELSRKNELIEQAPIGVTVADMTQPDEPLVEINPAFERLTGYGVEETLGENCRFLQGEDTDPEKVAKMREAIEANEPVQVTLRNYQKDGTMFWNEVTLAPLHDADGNPRYYVGFQQDATGRKEYELALKEQRDDLDLLTRMLQHDIRNDLQLIQGHGELAREHVDEAGRKHLDTTLDATADAIELTQTARELAETVLETNYEPKPVQLVSILQAEVDTIRESYPDAAISVVGELPAVQVTADDLLDSVFRNILRNAIQHNDKETAEVTVSAIHDDGRVRIRFADNGPGIPDDSKESIFGKGEKGLESEGTGIGTYLVKTLVKRYNGDVWVEDNDPEGAVFVVSLPVAE